MEKKYDSYLDALYYGDKGPLIIGLTGYTGAGCSTTKKVLSNKDKINLPGFRAINKSNYSSNNEIESERDKRIYNKLENHWKDIKWESFVSIEVSKIIFSFLLFEIIHGKVSDSKYQIIVEFIKLKDFNLDGLEFFYTDSIFSIEKAAPNFIEAYENTIQIYEYYKNSISMEELGDFIELLQNLGDEIRRYGKAVQTPSQEVISPDYIYTLPKAMGRLIKAYQIQNKSNNFVIDTFKNPFEIEYFRHRYSNFFVVGIIRDVDKREKNLLNILFKPVFQKIDKREKAKSIPKTKDKINKWITSQDIKECLGKADVYISNVESPSKSFEHLKYELVKLIALITSPGCILPSEDERSMQIAMTARLSSGCISRQVGAVILDENKSVLGVGWNDPPSGQVPCALRTSGELINEPTEEVFSTFERTPEFSQHIKTLNRPEKPFCFREELSNFNCKPKQAEYTRALHAEENAMIQALSKGRESLKGSTLYTTSSTCTLCAKKAYQLSISRIVYIDEYYDLAIIQTLESGNKNIKLDLFSGIIGSAYHKLYNSAMPEKTVLNLYT